MHCPMSDRQVRWRTPRPADGAVMLHRSISTGIARGGRRGPRPA